MKKSININNRSKKKIIPTQLMLKQHLIKYPFLIKALKKMSFIDGTRARVNFNVN